jgi:hypothetical protein
MIALVRYLKPRTTKMRIIAGAERTIKSVALEKEGRRARSDAPYLGDLDVFVAVSRSMLGPVMDSASGKGKNEKG